MNHYKSLSRKTVVCISLIAVLTVILVQACRKDPDLSKSSSAMRFEVPQGWPAPAYNFENNPLTDEGFELGRKLFYDPRFSRTNDISCGTCHQSFAAFAQSDHTLSHGVDNQLGVRNSPGLFNLAWHPQLMWDGGVNHLEVQPLAPIENPVEMDETLPAIIAKLQQDPNYKQHFKVVFGSEEINSQRILKAMAQFMGAMVSSNSRYDKYVRNEPGGAFSEEELKGLQVFTQNCASCHKEPLFTDLTFRSNGLSPSASNDSGRATITKTVQDLYIFKVPSLRNLKYSAPYMHDGRFGTLQQVLDYYNSGINPASINLDPSLQHGIQLSQIEQQQLLSFLNTLNDEEFVNNKRFQEPRF